MLVCALLLLSGCGSPDQENIRLRKLNQDLNEQVAALTEKAQANQRTVNGLLERSPTIPTLPPAQLQKMWITAGLKFGRLTGGVDLDEKPGDEVVRVYVCPVDETGMAIQSAGAIEVELFDLAEKGDNRLGAWTWDTTAAKAEWRTFFLEFGYQLNCPWKKVPRHSDITIRVKFTDELTHIPYTAEKVVRVELPPSGAPATAPATTRASGG